MWTSKARENNTSVVKASAKPPSVDGNKFGGPENGRSSTRRADGNKRDLREQCVVIGGCRLSRMSEDSARPAGKADSIPKVDGRHTKVYRAVHIRSGKNLAMSLVEDRTNVDRIMAYMKGERQDGLAAAFRPLGSVFCLMASISS